MLPDFIPELGLIQNTLRLNHVVWENISQVACEISKFKKQVKICCLTSQMRPTQMGYGEIIYLV